MADIKKIKLGDRIYDVRDASAARASDLAAKQDALTAGNGIAIDNSDVIRTTGIPFGTCDSTSTSKVFTATVPGIYKLEDGVCCIIKNGVVTSESGFTLNVNGLGAKPSYSNMATGNDVTPTDPTRDTTIFNINYAMLFVYSSTIVDGGGWICYRGYDANTNTIGYQLRHNSSTLPASDKFYRYRLLFTSADGTKYVPANTSSSTNGTASRTVNLRPIDPFGEIVYYSSTSAVNAGANPAATVLWDEYVLNLGYSFNRTGAALVLTYPKPVYIKCAPQTNGSAIIDDDTPYVQNLPSTNDGKIYIFLGIAYSATNIELLPNHPVYYHDGTGIRIWTGKNITKVSELTNDSGFITSSSLNGLASTSYVDTKVAGVVNSAPETLDTLNELATALGNDPNFATTITTQLGNKVDKETGKSLMTDAERTKLQGIAAGAEVNVQPNWTQTNTSADDYIKNKPTLATVATSGSYDDLSDKPIYLVTLSIDNNDQLTSDKDYDEISEAIQDGKLVIAELSKTESESSSYKQSFRYSAFILSQDINAIGFTALGVGSNSSITTLGCVKSGTETIWSIGDIIIPRGVRLNGTSYNVNTSDGYIRLDEVLPTVAITGSYNDLTNKPTIPTSADIDAAKPLVVTLSSSDGGDTISCDKTNAEIYAASQSGRDVIVYYGPYQYRPSEISEDYAIFTGVDWDQSMLRQIFEINTIGNIQTVNYSSASYEPSLTFDNLPTANSNNPVKSGGVYSALQGKEDKCLVVTFTENNGVYSADKTLTQIVTAASNGVKVFGVLGYDLYNLVFYEDEAIFQSNFENTFSTLVVGGNYVEYHQGEFVKYKQYSNVTDLNADDPATGTIGRIPSTGVFYIYKGGSQGWKKLIVDSDLSSYVPTSRTINGKALTTNITLNASDVGADVFVVTVTETTSGNNTTYSANKTFAEITAAITDGREIRAFKDGQCYNLSYYDNEIIEFDYIDSESLYCQQIEINSSNSVIVFTRDLQSLLTFDNTPTQNSNNPVKSGGVYSALLGKQNKSIEMLAAYETLLSTLTGTSYENPVTLTGTALEQYNDLVNKYTDGNYSFLFLGTPLVTDSETWGNIGAMMFNILYGGNSLTDSISSFTINKQGDNYWVENTSRSIQAQLVSGTNIKTINNQSLLGSGNLTANDIGAATVSDINTAISNLVDSAPTTLNTLNELATALGNDPNFATTVTNKIAALQVHVGSVAGKLYRNNVAGSGNFTVTGNSGCIPNLTAGTFLVSIYAKSATQSYTFRFNFGSSVTYDLSTTNGEISDVRQITIPSNGTFSGLVLNGSVASGTILYVVLYNYLTPISTVGPAAVTNRYADLDGTPTIPTVNNGTLTILKNGTTVGTFTANQAGNTTANITVPTVDSSLTGSSQTNPVQGGAIYSALSGKANKNGSDSESFNASQLRVYDNDLSVSFDCYYESNELQLSIGENLEGGSLRYTFDDSGDIKYIATTDDLTALTASDVGADVFVVNISATFSGGTATHTSNKTFTEIYNAILAKKHVIAVLDGFTYYTLTYCENDATISFYSGGDASSIISIESDNSIHYYDQNYQPALVSGTNIKTINNQSLLGSGNLTPSLLGVPNIANNLTTTTTGSTLDATQGKALKDLIDGITVPSASTTTPVMDGTAAIGSSSEYAKADHVHPSDTSKANVITKTTVSTSGAVSLAMTSGVFYSFTGTPTSLTLTLTAPSTGLGIYAGKFTASSTGCTLSVPASVTESIDNPNIVANGTYEFNIMDNVLLMVQI